MFIFITAQISINSNLMYVDQLLNTVYEFMEVFV